MSMNLIAMLVSLAMMLTGAGGGVQPEALPVAETARTLTLSNVNVTWNGETLSLAPQAHIGVTTDGQKAVYDFGVDLDGERRLPVQLKVDETGITALSANSGVAVNVTAEALAGLAGQLEAQMNASMATAGGDNAQLMRFITEEYMPAYTGLLKLAMDPEQYERINAVAQSVFDRVIDRGEGRTAALEVDGEQYDVTAYSYSMDAMQMAALSDAMFTEIPELGDYYNALFRLYDMMPEESGLKGLDSYTALFERFGIQMRLDIEEQRNDDGSVDVMDGVLTIDPNSLVNMPQSAPGNAAQVADAQPGAVDGGESQMQSTAPETGDEAAADVGEAEPAETVPEEAPEQGALDPMVMDLHAVKIPDYKESNVTCTYSMDGHHGMSLALSTTDNAGVQEVEGTMFVTEDGRKTQGGKLSAFLAQDGKGGASYSMSLKVIQQDVARVDVDVYGMENADGTSQNSAAIEARTPGMNVAVSFDFDVTGDPIEDLTGGVKPVCVINDLSEEGIQSLAKNPLTLGGLMQGLGSLTADVNALKVDPSVQSLLALIQGDGMPIDVDALDEAAFDIDTDFGGEPEGDAGEYELVIGDGDESPFDFDAEPAEDDGVLPFAEPKLNWLPKGWTVSGTETDTAYDWVQLSITDASGAEAAYAIFFQDTEGSSANYLVQTDGKVLEGRMMNVTDFGEGGLSVTVNDNGMYGNLMFTSEAIELETIGQIVAGIEF